MSMMDVSTAYLLQQLRRDTNGLWLADENSRGIWATLANHSPALQVITNRFDLACAAQNCGIPASFCDWQFEPEMCFDAIFLRICKEKAINQHLIREAFLHLNRGGNLLIAGEKNEGIKSIWEYACRVFHGEPRLKKQGSTYAGILTKSSDHTVDETSPYHQIQIIGEWDGVPIFSKPGVYGWDKIDAGSALLIEQLRLENPLWADARSVLDLGCGYGFLTFASSWLRCERRVASDNNAGALICTKKNADERKLTVETVAADKADRVDGKFDLVLCNPPFHRGFDVDGDLTRDFLVAAKRKLAVDGAAIFVVNSFIPLEKKLGGLFTHAQLLADNRQFKVLVLKH
jgi:16S rRNA (guanine1207-N2)-methyltransferase